ncbi:methyltransferase domain-containing protein [Rhizobium sp. P32RR-XVIII]|uniref:class I SAM-dependent methyltransferase n=1 Tax=Rhizobium sp. P32RR-XVIII TaxID=2726738 RepID=UPI001456360D|nr:class I SAM-dependent methyltransferase [Rhizobium sp. P32RR-XVIII]NLS07074.1 methyltransferase domain-containing protein [Rhizobium sp. P32RR-XVIII]
MHQVAAQSNYSLKDEIKAYWSVRAETFDTQPGHEIFSEAERAAWHELILRHLGEGKSRRALDLASGTGVVSHLLDDLGFSVTGIDWAEPMLERARAKAKSRGQAIRFLMGDAENTMEADASYDIIINRHLVWTLVDPKAAFAEWHRVLKPGGKLLIIDSDFVNPSLVSRLANRLADALSRLRRSSARPHQPPALAETHKSILSRVYFSKGARAEAVAALLTDAGFSTISIDTNMRTIHKTQRGNFTFLKGLERATQHRYAICAVKA